jgi:hypothetical protein
VSVHLQFIWDNLPNLLLGFPQDRPGGLRAAYPALTSRLIHNL